MLSCYLSPHILKLEAELWVDFSRGAEWKGCCGLKQLLPKQYYPEGEREQVQCFPGQRSPPVSTLIPHCWSDNQKTALSWNHWPENCGPCGACRSGAILMAYALPMPVLTICVQLETGSIVATPEREAAIPLEQLLWRWNVGSLLPNLLSFFKKIELEI